MAAATRRISNYATRSTATDLDGRPKSSDDSKKEIWIPMLDGVSSGKRMPEKSLLVLGGTPETQKGFLESLSKDPATSRRPPDRGRRPPIANQFALGYTYLDVLDSDQEDTLARLSLYLLTQPTPSFTPLLKPYLTPKTLPNMLIVILLDWEHPWLWLRQLRDWIRVLRSLVSSLDDESKDVMEENINAWRDRHRGLGGSSDNTGSGSADTAVLPLGQGEWDEPLGIPLCVVCQNADKIEGLERERGWKEEEFDFVLQYLRTVLLKHGASLIYTMNSAPGPLQTLIHSSLGIKSMLRQKQLKHNVIDRDHILIPPNWDSWGKIRILREGFDVEGVSQAWSEDIQAPLPTPTPVEVVSNGHTKTDTEPETETGELVSAEPEPAPEMEELTAVSVFEETIRDPEQDSALAALNSKNANGLEVPSTEAQTFLTSQVEILDRLRQEDDREKKGADKKKSGATYIAQDEASGVVEEHIGPVQFNMGGIQVNADEMVKRLQVCHAAPLIV
ncbi:uncharacterized protein BDZ99DRAFT_77169 [Mytilinidion resinicola]|uniref:Dynein n=1 Tax=Mytilinidion resinicola TaxID=574789 RepID=A0A6A6YEV7_9PEZI|nr:uncharacterized protein BDZ99DRAFT_77169 [Mytilinidion resinicola]KAF2807270.1 hypothetical protein BDZ99DRAFT_77169 [Mytilinidion resinicola]